MNAAFGGAVALFLFVFCGMYLTEVEKTADIIPKSPSTVASVVMSEQKLSPAQCTINYRKPNNTVDMFSVNAAGETCNVVAGQTIFVEKGAVRKG